MIKRSKKLESILGKTPPTTRYDDHCTKCGEDLDHEKLAELFEGVRVDINTPKQARYACPYCDSIQLVSLDISFTIRATGMRRKKKDS